MADAKFADIELLHRDTGILGDEEDATDDDEPCIEGRLTQLRLSNEYVKLNVGGTLFYTTVGTLTKRDGMLRAMFSGRMEIHKDEDGTPY